MSRSAPTVSRTCANAIRGHRIRAAGQETPAFPDLVADQGDHPVPESSVSESQVPGSRLPEPPNPLFRPRRPRGQPREGRSKAPASTVDERPADPAPESGAELAEAGPL